MSLSRQETQTWYRVLVLVLLLGVVAYFLWFYLPNKTTLLQAKQAYNEVGQEIIVGRRRLHELQNYAQAVVELKAQVDQVETRLLGGNRILLLLQALRDQAQKAGVTITEITPLPVRSTGEIWEQPVTVSVKSGIRGQRRFLELIEGLPYPTAIQQAILKAADSRGAEIIGEFTIVMYFLERGEV